MLVGHITHLNNNALLWSLQLTSFIMTLPQYSNVLNWLLTSWKLIRRHLFIFVVSNNFRNFQKWTKLLIDGINTITSKIDCLIFTARQGSKYMLVTLQFPPWFANHHSIKIIWKNLKAVIQRCFEPGLVKFGPVFP